jgi:hypothetical protein
VIVLVEDPAKPLARGMPRRAIWSGSVISGGSGRSGLALAMPWWGRWLVEGLELAQGPWEALPVPDQRAVEESRRQECTHRSEIAFIRGIRTTGAHHGDPPIGQHRIEQPRELPFPVPDQ